MANFELRIYGVRNSYIEDFEIKKGGSITDKDFVELAEAKGYVATLHGLLSKGGLFETAVCTYRAYLIDVDNEEAEPVRVDLYNTVMSVSKVTSIRQDYNPKTSWTYETPIIQYTEPVHA